MDQEHLDNLAHLMKHCLGSPDIRFVDAGIAKPKYIKELRLINGLSNRCGCGESSLTKKAFIKHVQNAHKGITLPEI